jgi:uncharacterized protein (DUF1697 family)
MPFCWLCLTREPALSLGAASRYPELRLLKVKGKMMHTYITLIRGINVGGKNKVPMAALRKCLEELGFSNVSTYIASGNVILESDKSPDKIKAQIEEALPKSFKLDNDLIKVLVLSRKQLQAVIDNKPEGFGEEPEKYHSDAIFLMDFDLKEAMAGFDPREGVDKVWPGDGVIYSQRLSSQRTKSRLNKIMSTPAYKSMTIRSWSTTTKLLELLKK